MKRYRMAERAVEASEFSGLDADTKKEANA